MGAGKSSCNLGGMNRLWLWRASGVPPPLLRSQSELSQSAIRGTLLHVGNERTIALPDNEIDWVGLREQMLGGRNMDVR